LQIAVQAGQTNYLVVDGLNGAAGTLRLTYNLVTPASLSLIGLSSATPGHVRVVGRPGMRFTVQSSTNLLNWSALLTTNSATSIYDYVDPTTNQPRRFYRAIMLPFFFLMIRRPP